MNRNIVLYPLLMLFSFTSFASGQAANWRRSVSTERRTGERTTSVTTTSVNTVKSFGRMGRGTLTISSYLTSPGMTVHTFAKVPKTAGSFVSAESWYDDDKPSSGVWVQLEGENTRITDISVDLNRLLNAKTFNVRVAGIDDEKHLLTFNVQGLAPHLNFLEIKADKNKK